MSGKGDIFPLGPGLAGRHFAMLGLARTGLASVAAIVAAGAKVSGWDDRDDARAAAAALGAAIAPIDAALLAECDALLLSPGVPLDSHPVAQMARQMGKRIIGDIELFALARAHLPAHRVVAITGTNGKSTSTALIHHVLVSAGVAAQLGGNIGLPILSRAPLAAGGVYVLELSSYQIDLTHSLAADVAVLTNITPDHLDRYGGDFHAYAASKERLFALQQRDDVAVIACDDDPSRQIASRIHHRLVRVSAADISVDDQRHWPALQGPHNAQNAAVAIAALRTLGLDDAAIMAGLATYPGLPHRMELVGEIAGVRYYNDSKATNPDSSAPALAAWPPVDGKPRIHWILGGRAKGKDIGPCADWLGHVAHAWLIGEAAGDFARAIGDGALHSHAGDLASALTGARAMARAGDIILLSPAAASFDQFRDFEARGDAFRALVAAIGGRNGQQ